MSGEPEGGTANWLRRWLLAGAAPFLGTAMFLGACLFGIHLAADPVRYARPSSLFFPEILPPPTPTPVVPPRQDPPPEHPFKEYEAEGVVDREVSHGDVQVFETNRADDPEPRLLDAKTRTERSESRSDPGHLAIVFAFDDSGSMGNQPMANYKGNDQNNDRYRIVLRLLARMGKYDRVCLTRTTSSPVLATDWRTPGEASAIIKKILDENPTMNDALGLPDANVFNHRGDDLFQAVSTVLGEVDPKDYRRSLLFLGDGDESNFGYRRGMVESFLSESILMSGVIFGKEARSVDSGRNVPLVEDAKKTGGEVRGAKDTEELEAMMKGLFEKARSTVRLAHTLGVRFSSRAEYRPGDVVEVGTRTGLYRLRVK